MQTVIKREELYEQVWTMPITKIAASYGVSDSAIIKMCKKMEIPRPGVGYWTQVQHGRTINKPRLRKLSKHGAESHQIHLPPTNASKTASIKGPIDPKTQRPLRISVVDTLDAPHPLVAANIKRFKNAKPDAKGILRSESANHFDLEVSRDSLDRALRIMNSLLYAFDQQGWALEIQTEPTHRMSARVQEEQIFFSIKETFKGTELSWEERQARARASRNRSWPERYEFSATGILKLSIDTGYYYSQRSSWSDGKIQRVENCLDKFCTTLLHYSYAMKERRIEVERDRIMRGLQEASAEKVRARKAYNKHSKLQLFKEIESWRLANDIREYVAASAELVSVDTDLLEAHATWSQWALTYADSIDPLKGGTPIERQEEKNPQPRSNTNYGYQHYYRHRYY